MVRVGLVGFGFIGAGLYRAIVGGDCAGLEIAFVWNRSADKLESVPQNVVLHDRSHFEIICLRRSRRSPMTGCASVSPRLLSAADNGSSFVGARWLEPK